MPLTAAQTEALLHAEALIAAAARRAAARDKGTLARVVAWWNS